ncbi:MAG TPA: MFS transporter, partial [Arthrobacter sp.]|nr:MFS transporter [Arthrobacter sp.]
MSNTSITRSSTGTVGNLAAGNSAAGPSTPAPRAPWRDWLALALLMFPVLLVAVDNTALTFALPAIARSLDASGVELLWIVDAYPLVLAGLLVAMGSLGDRIGRRRLLFIGSTGFAAVSAVTAFAPSAEWLIAGRAGLGFFGAMLMPSTLSLIRNIFPEPNRRRLAVAIWAAGFSGGAALGPIFGGWLVEHFWWGAILLVAVPIILPLLVLGPALIQESRDPNPGRVDVPSIVLSLLVMVPVVYGIKVLATHGLALEPLAAIAFGLLMGYVFVRRQRHLLAGGLPQDGPAPGSTADENRTAPLL